MKRTSMTKQLAVLAALGAIATGCSGSNDDSPGTRPGTVDDSDNGLFEGDEQGRTDDTANGTTGNSDAEGRLAETSETGAPAEQMSDKTDSPSALDLEGEMAAEEPIGETDGGLFETPPPDPDDTNARDENNTFENYGYRDFVETSRDPLSTFALDVDTGSYSVARRWIEEGSLPPIESVRPEEWINAFDYGYDDARNGLEISVDAGPSPFETDNYLVRIGVQGEIVDEAERRPAALTFVIDTSGSMDRDDRLGLVKESLAILVDQLQSDDTVAIVTYSDRSGIVLRPTPASDRNTILDAIDELGPGGSTNLEAGLREGYDLARDAFREDGINRVVLASDGVANVGVTDPDQLARMIRNDADAGINLVTVGFGMGNFNDTTMEQLADQGDGFYAYVDTEDEAERLFEDELTSTLLTVAKDAKIQVEFNEDVVDSYRLIGFENRGVRDSDFRVDAVDAGELGAGHQVTAIYEIELERGVDVGDRDEIGEVFLRWEDPDDGEVIEINDDIDLRDIEPEWTRTPADFRLATVVATFAEIMRDNPHAGDIDIDDLADEVDRLADDMNDRAVDDLADLIELAATLR